MDLMDLTMKPEDITRSCNVYSELEKPKTFREAWDHPDPFHKKNSMSQKEKNLMT